MTPLQARAAEAVAELRTIAANDRTTGYGDPERAEALAALIAELAAALPVWRELEAMPDSEQYGLAQMVIVALEDGYRTTGWKTDGCWWTFNSDEDTGLWRAEKITPTKWMPLPAPPPPEEAGR